MNCKISGVLAAGLLVVSGMTSAIAATSFVDFETTPNIPTGPSIYIAVPAQQTIDAGPATFSGGVVLGFATFFPAIAFATAPNVYGTADFGNHLARDLTITINPTFNNAPNNVTEVSFALFNGEVFTQTYNVVARDGAGNTVASQTLANMATNFNSGYGLVDLVATGSIASVTISAAGTPAAWDFLIDSVAFNQSITSVINNPNVVLPPVNTVSPPAPATPPVQGHRHGNSKGEVEPLEINFGDDVNDIRGQSVVLTTPVPEPAEWLMMLAGLGCMLGMARRRRAAGQSVVVA